MTREKLNKYYLYSITWLVEDRSRFPKKFEKLLERLHETPFRYSIPMDANREDDGINLRYRYGEEYGYDMAEIAAYLDDRPCSVLEMMTALCVRCEKSIMDGYSLKCLPRVDSFTEYLFGLMLDNLGLSEMDDCHFDIDYVDERVNRFLDRDYAYNGDGGLFKLENPPRDLRGVEIWYQMCWYIDEMLNREEVRL